MLALDGTKGRTLWERPLDAEFHWAQCGLQTGTRRSWHCLLSHSDNLTAIDKYTGDVVWQQPQPTGLRSSLPVLSVPDLDGDKVSDVVLVASDDTQVKPSDCLPLFLIERYTCCILLVLSEIHQISVFFVHLQTQLILLSGKKGTQIGSTVIIDSIGTNNHLLHYTKGGSYYVLLQRGW
ncbi:hypothetical protein GOODEAATRI_009032 [Goodea atripinnis]|uniref:FAM234A/B beta-propeller domain-containing protein n=1 Tax=Goodea atripinnis TaxID=208336 RepID=A0ABV0NA38_9TELE